MKRLLVFVFFVILVYFTLPLPAEWSGNIVRKLMPNSIIGDGSGTATVKDTLKIKDDVPVIILEDGDGTTQLEIRINADLIEFRKNGTVRLQLNTGNNWLVGTNMLPNVGGVRTLGTNGYAWKSLFLSDNSDTYNASGGEVWFNADTLFYSIDGATYYYWKATGSGSGH